MVKWHIDLPQCPLRSGFSSKPRPNTVTSEMDTGFPKSRKKFSKTGTDYSLSLLMDRDQLILFKDFYDNELGSGAVSFEWVEPISEEPMICRITAITSMGVPAGAKYIVALTMTGWL